MQIITPLSPHTSFGPLHHSGLCPGHFRFQALKLAHCRSSNLNSWLSPQLSSAVKYIFQEILQPMLLVFWEQALVFEKALTSKMWFLQLIKATEVT